MAKKNKSKSKSKSKSKILLRPGDIIGSMAAEDDHEFLKECFVDLPIIQQLKDIDSPRSFLIGRTGAGKSAILWHLEQKLTHVSRLDPSEASFGYIANSTILQYLDKLGVDMTIFYEYLWKHILCLHIIRECLNMKTEERFNTLLTRIRGIATRDQRYARLLNYLTESKDKFWVNIDEVPRHRVESFDHSLAFKVGTTVAKLEAEIAAKKEHTTEFKSDLIQRGQEIVRSLQIQELTKVIETLSELVGDKQENFYILIDDLEENWGGEQIQYPLIKALLHSHRKFQQFENLKIIIAIREDIYESTLRSIDHKPFQPEKYESKLCRIIWNPAKLNHLIDRRINHFFKKQYEKKDIGVKDVLPAQVLNRKIGEFLAERTLQRPRDIISFINEIFANLSENTHLPLSARQVLAAETNYSRKRIEALCVEWKSCHPNLNEFLHFLQKFIDGSTFEGLDKKRVEDLLVTFAAKEPEDDIEQLAKTAFENLNNETIYDFKIGLLCCLFKVGAIGIKFGPTSPTQFCYDCQATINEYDILIETKFYVHPMLKSALHINPAQINHPSHQAVSS